MPLQTCPGPAFTIQKMLGMYMCSLFLKLLSVSKLLILTAKIPVSIKSFQLGLPMNKKGAIWISQVWLLVHVF